MTYKIINPETLKINRSEFMLRVWQWAKAGKRFASAMKQVSDEFHNQKLSLTFKASSNPDKDLWNSTPDVRSYYTGNSLSILK